MINEIIMANHKLLCRLCVSLVRNFNRVKLVLAIFLASVFALVSQEKALHVANSSPMADSWLWQRCSLPHSGTCMC